MNVLMQRMGLALVFNLVFCSVGLGMNQEHHEGSAMSVTSQSVAAVGGNEKEASLLFTFAEWIAEQPEFGRLSSTKRFELQGSLVALFYKVYRGECRGTAFFPGAVANRSDFCETLKILGFADDKDQKALYKRFNLAHNSSVFERYEAEDEKAAAQQKQES